FQRRTHAHVFARGRTPHASAFPYAPCTVLGPAARLGYLAGGIAPSLDRALAQSGARLAFAHFGVNGAYALPFEGECVGPVHAEVCEGQARAALRQRAVEAGRDPSGEVAEPRRGPEHGARRVRKRRGVRRATAREHVRVRAPLE